MTGIDVITGMKQSVPSSVHKCAFQPHLGVSTYLLITACLLRTSHLDLDTRILYVFLYKNYVIFAVQTENKVKTAQRIQCIQILLARARMMHLQILCFQNRNAIDYTVFIFEKLQKHP